MPPKGESNETRTQISKNTPCSDFYFRFITFRVNYTDYSSNSYPPPSVWAAEQSSSHSDLAGSKHLAAKPSKSKNIESTQEFKYEGNEKNKGVIFNLDPENKKRVVQGAVNKEQSKTYAKEAKIPSFTPAPVSVSFPWWQKVLAAILFLGALGGGVVLFLVRRSKKAAEFKKPGAMHQAVHGAAAFANLERITKNKGLPFKTLKEGTSTNLKLIVHHPDFSTVRKVLLGWLIFALVVGGLGVYGFFLSTPAFANPDLETWPFTTPGNYTYDSNKVEITGGVAKLKQVDQTDDDNSSTGFGGGTHNNTQWDGGNNWLELTNPSNPGDFISRVMDAGGTASWNNISWTPQRPLYKELPDNKGQESGYPTGNADMTGNVLLMHMNDKVEDSSTTNDNSGIAQGGADTQADSGGPSLGREGSFDGTNDYVDISSYYPVFTGDFAISFWVNFDSYNNYQNLLSSADNGWCNNGFWLEFGAAEGFRMWTGYRQEILTDNVQDLRNLSTGQWYYITVVRNGSGTNNLKLYVDNSLAGQNTYTGTVGSVAQSLLIARYHHTSTSSYLDGLIDEVAIYDKALSASERSNLYNSGDGYEHTGNEDGLVSVWHMDEDSWAIQDTSGEGNNGTAKGGVTYNATGKLNSALSFDGVDDYVDCGNTGLDFGTSGFTTSLWFKTSEAQSVNQRVMGKYDSGTPSKYWGFFIFGSQLRWYAKDYIYTTVDIWDDNWHHIVGVRKIGGDLEIFIDGISVKNGTVTVEDFTWNAPFSIGRWGNYGVSYSNSKMDEVAIWNRALGSTEIADIYKRGVLKLKYQVRSGSSSPPTGDFIGPDGTTGTYYSELQNDTTTIPSLSLTNVPDNRYFQYKAYLETDDTSYSPELKSVTIGPDHYPANNPTVVNISPAPTFSILNTFSETLGGGNQGSVKYQISNNGTDWYYHNGSNWVAASGYAQTNTAAEVNANAGTFDDDVGAGNFYFKSFLHSDSTQQVELDQVDLDYTMENITLTSPNIGETMTVQGSHLVTWTYIGSVGSTVDLFYSTDGGQTYPNQIANDISIGAGGSGSFNWDPIPDDISDQVRVKIVSDLAFEDESDGDNNIFGSFTISSPNGGETWGALSTRQITWSTIGTIPKVDIHYSTDSGQTFPYTIATNISNTGSRDWTLPNLDDTTTVQVRVRDHTYTSVLDTSDTDFTIDYYQITWNVLDSESSEHLTTLSVNCSSGWSEINLNSPITHDYPYATYTTTWIKSGYNDKTEENWTIVDPNQMAQENTVYMESIVGAEPVYNAFSNFAYDAENDTLKINSWLERNGQLLTDPDSVEIKIYDSKDNLVQTLNAPPPTVDNNGVFWQEWTNTGMASNKVYFAKTTITRETDSYTSGDGYSIYIPLKIKEHEEAQAGERAAQSTHRTLQSTFRTNTTSSLSTIQSGISKIDTDVQTVLSQLTTIDSNIDSLLVDIASVQAKLDEAKSARKTNYNNLYNKLVTINSDLKDITEEVGTNETINNILTVSSASRNDINKIRNKLLDLQAVTDNIRIMLGQDSAAVTTWFTFGSVILNMLITNPTETTQKIPFKAYLPKEVKQEHIISSSGLKVAYDAKAETYYVHTTLSLGPGESVTRKVKIKDIWTISEDEINSLRSQTEELASTLSKTAYSSQAITLKSDIDARLDKILRKQKESNATPQDHIVAYRENQEDLKVVEEELQQLKELITSSGASNRFLASLGGVQTVAVWGIIIALVSGLGVLGMMFFRMWKNQMVMSQAMLEKMTREGKVASTETPTQRPTIKKMVKKKKKPPASRQGKRKKIIKIRS